MAYCRTDGIPERDQRPCDNGYKSVFINSWLVRQRHRSWIKGLGKKSTKRVNSFTACSAFCPGPPNRDPRDSEKRWLVYTSIAMMACHEWRVYKSSGKTHKNQNACIDVYMASDANWLTVNIDRIKIKIGSECGRNLSRSTLTCVLFMCTI